MGSVPVVLVQPVRKCPSALFGAVIGAGVGPLSQCGLDQPLGLAVGSWRIGPGAQVTQAQTPQEPTEAPRLVAGAIVSHHPGKGHAQAAVVAQRLQQRTAGSTAALVVFDGAEGNPGVIIDSQVDEFPASAILSVLAVTGHAVAGSPEPPQLLDVQVQQVAGLWIFVAVVRPL